jgi:hypothetical protein
MVLRLKKLADRSGTSAALHRFIGHILLSVLSGNTCVLPTLGIYAQFICSNSNVYLYIAMSN